MKCPIDGEVLVVADRSGIEIDYCPKCRGIWLDRGELDKIIERTSPQSTNIYVDRREDDQRDRGGLLAEIFDFLT